MNNISVGAIVAAIIAALVSLFGLIIGKEQKISEFRQAWIDALRADIVKYSASVHAVSAKLKATYPNYEAKVAAVERAYGQLNEASYAIKLRINPDEDKAKELFETMTAFEKLSSSDREFSGANINPLLVKFTKSSQDLLKLEWQRVKRGEITFRVAKVVSGLALIASFVAAAWIGIGATVHLHGNEMMKGDESKDWRLCAANWARRLYQSTDPAPTIASAIAHTCARSVDADVAKLPNGQRAQAAASIELQLEQYSLLSVLRARSEFAHSKG